MFFLYNNCFPGVYLDETVAVVGTLRQPIDIMHFGDVIFGFKFFLGPKNNQPK